MQKITGQVTITPGGRMWYGSGNNSLHFGGDVHHGAVANRSVQFTQNMSALNELPLFVRSCTTLLTNLILAVKNVLIAIFSVLNCDALC